MEIGVVENVRSIEKNRAFIGLKNFSFGKTVMENGDVLATGG